MLLAVEIMIDKPRLCSNCVYYAWAHNAVGHVVWSRPGQCQCTKKQPPFNGGPRYRIHNSKGCEHWTRKAGQ